MNEATESAAGGFGAATGSYAPRERRAFGGYGGGRGGDRSYQPRERREYAPRNEYRDVTPSESIYVGNLLFDITKEDLEREFSEYGNIVKSTIATDARQLSKGYVLHIVRQYHVLIL